MLRCTPRWQVILLHGPTGTGKTATVEAIAEHFKRPLYSLSVYSLPLDTILLVDTLTSRLDVCSSTAVHFDANSLFSQAARSWNAIVLIEAGDVRYFACLSAMS
jgi:MoxR-like ATPase